MTKRLLILDDDDQNARSLSETPRALGWEVLSTWSAREGLKDASINRFDVVWVDPHVQDMYVGEVIARFLELPTPPKTVLMVRPSRRISLCRKSRTQCLQILRSDIPELLRTLADAQWNRLLPAQTLYDM